MYASDQDETDALLGALKDEEKTRRRQAEKVGGLVLAGTGLLLAGVFLWVLAVSLKKPLDLMMTLVVVGGGVAVFAWGLKTAVIGRKTKE